MFSLELGRKDKKMDKEFKELLKSIGVNTKWFGIWRKSTYRVLKEISKKWSVLDDETQHKIELNVCGLKK
jgi:hypothetical protein